MQPLRDCAPQMDPSSGSLGPRRFEEALGVFLSDSGGLPILWRIPAHVLARTVDYDLPALHDAPPSSLGQLSRNTDHDICFFEFIFRMWPVSSCELGLSVQPDAQLALLLAAALRCLVGDHPGFLFLRSVSVDRACRVGVVPARHSRTKWLLDFGARIASAPPFELYHDATSLQFVCRFLTMPQHRHCPEQPSLLPDGFRFALPSGSPSFLPTVDAQRGFPFLGGDCWGSGSLDGDGDDDLGLEDWDEDLCPDEDL